MARIELGDDLTTPIVQPGWTVADDGFGLHTSTVNFTFDGSLGFPVVRGNAHPSTDFTYMKAHRTRITVNTLGMTVCTADYVGIDPTVNAGSYTNPQIQASNGLTSESITTNPNFFVSGGDAYSTPIAGTTYTQSDIGPPVKKRPSTLEGVPVVGNVITSYEQSWIGNNGACFEREEGGRFIGFVDPTYKKYYGKTNYLAPTTSWSGVVYVSDDATVQQFIYLLGSTANDNDWASTLPKIVPEYAGTTWTAEDGSDQLLLSQVNIEDFGSLKKVTYEVRFAKQGWDNSTYPDSDLL